VGWRRWTAVVVGFCGILLIVKPTGDAFRIAILLPIVSIWGGVARDIITRRIAATESSVATLSFTTAGTALVGILTLPFGWSLPGGTDALLFLVGGFFFGTAHFCMIESLRLAEAAVVVPFRYFNVIWGALFGYMLWGDVPDAWIVSGISLVVVSGLYIMHRETSQRAVAAGPPTGPA
jgi:drug/metabolite transporter (DMT)-like permease